MLFKIATGLISSKVIALFVGPQGLALLGNLRNVMTSLETITTLGFQNGIVKYVAENNTEKEELKKVISTVLISVTIVALVLSVLLFFMSTYLNDIIFGSAFKYSFVFKALAVSFPWYAASLVLISVINGLSKFKDVIYITIFGNSIGLIISVFMIWQYRTYGALLSTIIAPSMVFFAALYFINREIKLWSYITYGSYSVVILKKMSSYSLMAFVSAVLSPLVFLLIRKNVIMAVGMEQAGYWEAMNKISAYYLMFIGTILTLYFLPKLVQANNHKETNAVFQSYFITIMPIFILGLFLLFVLKDFVVRLLFSHDFLPVKDLFLWQISGDILKGFSLILGYNLIAKKHTVVFVLTELISMAIMYFASFYLISVFGIKGVVMAHCATYVVYLITLVIYFRRVIFNRNSNI